MDRDTTIIMAATIIFLTIAGGLLLRPSGNGSAQSALEARAAAAGVPAGDTAPGKNAAVEEEAPNPKHSAKFKPDDIRFKYQQAELKKGKKRKFMAAVPDAPQSEEGSADAGEEPAAEEPSADEGEIDDTAEEPEIND